MAFITTRVVKTARVIRNNWKKSLFFSSAGLWLSSLAIERNRINNLMRSYCEEASKIGDEFLKPTSSPTHVTVILNPAARKRKCKKDYQNYVEPILNCAGFKVSLVTTETEGQERDLMNIMHNTDSVVIAGGSGSIHDAITGMLRRTDGVQYPLGVIPLGVNNVSSRLIHGFSDDGSYSKNYREARNIADATMAVVKNLTKDIDVLKIESLDRQKVIYSVSGFSFGFLRDVIAKCEGYWYLGNKAKPYLAMISNTLFRKFNYLAIDGDPEISYSLPCSGCSNCMQRSKRETPVTQEDVPIVNSKRWWSSFTPKPKPQPVHEVTAQEPPPEPKIDYSTVTNESCGKLVALEGETPLKDVLNVTLVNDPNDCQSDLVLHKAHNLTKGQFVLDGVAMRSGQMASKKFIETASEIETTKVQDLEVTLKPESKTDKYLEVDGEQYELENLLIQRLPKRVSVFSLQK